MLGCNGRGIVLATLWGRELARHAAGVAAREFVLPPSVPKRLWLHPVARPLVTGLIKYYALRDAIEDRRLEKTWPASHEGLRPAGRSAGHARLVLGGDGRARPGGSRVRRQRDGGDGRDRRGLYRALGGAASCRARPPGTAARRTTSRVWGASGRNNGQVVAALKHEPHEIEERFGKERGAALIRAIGGGPDLVLGLIARYAHRVRGAALGHPDGGAFGREPRRPEAAGRDLERARRAAAAAVARRDGGGERHRLLSRRLSRSARQRHQSAGLCARAGARRDRVGRRDPAEGGG